MQSIYLDNAATTKMAPEVVEVMCNSMLENYGNPSSIHHFGRKAKVTIETVRKNIGKQFNVSASQITFTSGGTEANNFILQNAVINLGIQRVITTEIEHFAVLKTVEYLGSKYDVEVVFVDVNEFGVVDLLHLKTILGDTNKKTLVSLMMVNNEIGNLLPMEKVSALCLENGALFHSDTVQAIGHYLLDLKNIPIDFITASAHKFHGPKGVGFVYIKKGLTIGSFFKGGSQEKGVRSGTENVHAILGMDKALSIAYNSLVEDEGYISSLKFFLKNLLLKEIDGVKFNGLSADMNNSAYTILNVRFPIVDKMLLFNLDLKGIAVSAGSACQSGASKKSHVLNAFLNDNDKGKVSIRFSFSRYSNQKELISVLKEVKKLI